MTRAALLVLMCLGTCSRDGTAPPAGRPRPAIAAVEAGVEAGVGPASPTVPRDAPSPKVAVVEPSAPQEIAVTGGPSLTIKPAGPALIEVVVGPGVSKAVEVERRIDGSDAGAAQHQTIERAPKQTPGGLSVLHAAKPGTSYLYRARLVGGAWSEPATVRTAESGGPPAAPRQATASAIGALAVRIGWEADARATAGFAVEVEVKGHWATAAVVDPIGRAFVHNHRTPTHAYAYRVRAFNAHGVSAPTAIATTTTPDRDPKVAPTTPPPPCTRLPPALDPQKVLGIPRDTLNRGGAKPLFNDPDPANHLRRHLYGEYEGCIRELGVFDLQADVSEVDGVSDEGWPLLRAIAGAGQYAGAQILTLRFSRGRYRVANEAHFCGDPWPDRDPSDPTIGEEGAPDDLTTFAPPFATCQRDFEKE